jgi:DNA-binding beta-propeller fold protein YncE
MRAEPPSGDITTVAGNGAYGFSGDNGPAASAELNVPVGVAVDSAGNLYIADTGNNRIRKISNGVITTVAGGGDLGSRRQRPCHQRAFVCSPRR